VALPFTVKALVVTLVSNSVLVTKLLVSTDVKYSIVSSFAFLKTGAFNVLLVNV